ncbi:glycosyltransferase [Jatrophihabitans sp. YIM 134969]
MNAERPRAVVVVAFGRPDLLDDALTSVASETVVVVDNSSSAAVRHVAETHGAQYLDPGGNLGFAAGVNRGLARLGGGRDVLLLNPDARLAPGAFDRLQAAFDGADRLAAVAPHLTDVDGAPQRVAWPYPSPGRMWREALGFASRAPGGPTFVVGAVLLLRAEALADVGPLDERYFLYAEEADWQRRALARGWHSAVVAEASAVHVGGGTSGGPGRQQALFHAGQETYVRRWWGTAGWTSYRAAAVVGAGVRAVVLPGPRGSTARGRLRLYLRGPRRIAGVSVGRPTAPALRITHVVVTDAAAGTERQVALTAATQFRAGHDVAVVGGDQAFLAAALPAGVVRRPGATALAAARAVATLGRRDIVHAHLTTADLVAALTKPLHGATVVSTRHIAKPRGSSGPARLAARLAERAIAREIAISAFVAAAVGRDAVVVPNAVAADDRGPDLAARRVLVAQRLEPEKATDLAVRAWAASGAAAAGWRLAIAGDGSERSALEDLVRVEAVEGVEFLGWVPDARDEMVRSSVLLATAPAEPFGLTVVEAMSLGLPVVAASGGAHLETVGATPDPLLFPPGDVAAAAAALREVTRLPRAELAARGDRLRDDHRRRFTPAGHQVRLDVVYRAAGAGSGLPLSSSREVSPSPLRS